MLRKCNNTLDYNYYSHNPVSTGFKITPTETIVTYKNNVVTDLKGGLGA